MMDAAGYDLNEAPRLFEMTVEYLAEVQAQRPGPASPFGLAQPVHVTNRVKAYRKLIARDYVEAAADPNRLRRSDEFARQAYPAMLAQAALELDRGRFDSASITVGRALEVDSGDPGAWVMLGEARERSKSARDLEGAMTAYQRALAIDARHAGAHRALGLLLYRDVKKGGALSADGAQARSHLLAYLRAAPDAPDVAHVRGYVADLAGGEAQ
jgi:tetratricopeptide (TPR) repeat protein